MTTPSSSSQATALTPDAAFSLERWSASSASDRTSRASLVLVGGGRRWYAHANGNGAIDALMRAVDDALARVLPAPVELLTYNVHASGHGHATAATVTLSVRDAGARAGAPAYPGRALHDNVLEASVVAYLDAINGLVSDREIDVAAVAPLDGVSPDSIESEGDDARTHARGRMMDAYNP